MQKPWWKTDENLAYERVVSQFQQIDSYQIGRLARYAYFLSLYEGKYISSLDNYSIDISSANLYNQESKENIIRPAIDALTAKISTNAPRLVTQTNGADFRLSRKAEDRTLLVEGVRNEQKCEKKARLVFKDGLIFDYGVMKVYPDADRKRVVLERVLPHELVVDEDDGRYMDPQNIYLIRIYPKDKLLAQYKKKASMIDNAGLIRDYNGVKFAGSPEGHCAVIEAYHLPSKPDGSDGRMVVCTDRGTLYHGIWPHECFPVAIWRFKTRQIGFCGFGAVEDIENYQKQLDFLDEKIGKLLNSMTVRLAIEQGSGVNPDDMTNEYDGFPVFEYNGQPPVIIPDAGPGPELFAERERKKQAAFEQLGISLLLAQSKKPAGLNAGVAIREYKDTESERFRDVGQAWDEFYIELAEKILIALEDLNKYVPDCEIKAPSGGDLKSISLSKVDWDRDKYRIAIRPAGLLPREPAGRLQTINELMQMFPNSMPLLASKLNNPDVDDAMSLVSAPISAIRADIDAMLDGDDRTPEPFIDLNLAIGIVLQSYQKLRAMDNVPDEMLEKLRNYMLTCKDILDQQQAAMLNAQFAGQPMTAGQQAPGGQQPAPTGPAGPPIPGGA